MVRSADNATDQRLSALEHACRGVVGDRLRSVSVDGPEYSGTLYRRSDLAPGTDGPVHEAMAEGASCEVLTDGGRSSPPSADPDGGQTVCEFDRGYVARMQIGETSVVATTDGLKMDRESELSAAVRGVFE
ncbi:DUF7522 family protein [Halolamina sediminis]|jgi:hypothetical protein|uniref:DUF7522 family protein n=1 Tax=Halolamina sediminis TaxID=1480675 RepID=UPI0006B5FBA4|nr:hypothetical protein [Halolamina sediminis]